MNIFTQDIRITGSDKLIKYTCINIHHCNLSYLFSIENQKKEIIKTSKKSDNKFFSQKVIYQDIQRCN